MTERTKAELLEEIKTLKQTIESMTKSQITVIDNACSLNRTIARYQAKLNRIDRIFAKQMQMALLVVLLANTIFLALRWL